MRARDLRWLIAAILTAIACVLSPAARANVAQSSFEGDRLGPLVARSETVLRVDSEDLVFDLDPTLESARVVATYRFSNPSSEPRKADAAFVFVLGEGASSKRTSTPTVTVDGAPTPFEVVTDVAQLKPQLDAWIAAHPERISAALQERDPSALRVLIEARDAGVNNDEVTLRAAREVIPEAVQSMEKGFTSLGGVRRLTWLAFTFEVPPGAAKTVTIGYTHTPGQDHAKRVSTVFTYEYLLSPAKTWAAFGPLHIVVKLPPNAITWSSMPWREEGAERRADFSSLPNGELVFEVMSTNGLWFGMTGHEGYWVIVIVALVAVAFATGRVGGRMWGKGGTSGIASVGWVAAIVIVSGIAATFACVVLTALFPSRALGFGYGPFFGLLLGVAVVCFVAPVIGARTRTGVRRASPTIADAT